MTFNANIPNPGDFLSDSQGQLKTNFSALNTSFSKNHIPLTTVANNGRHTFVEMVNTAGGQTTPPTTSARPTPLVANEGTLYTLLGAKGSDLYYAADNTNRSYKMTVVTDDAARYAKLGALTGSASLQTGWTFLGQGIIIQYGYFVPSANTNNISFPFAFTAVPFSISLQPFNATSSFNQIVVSALSASGFTSVSTTSSQTRIYYIAIGPSNG